MREWNFLAAILKRKLAIIDIMDKGKPRIWESESIKALMSVYGVDLLPDNVEECQLRLYDIWNDAYSNACKRECNDKCRETAMFILKRNILLSCNSVLKRILTKTASTMPLRLSLLKQRI